MMRLPVEKICPAALSFTAALMGTILIFTAAAAAPSSDLWPRWLASSPESSTTVDHSPWTRLLEKYLVTNHSSGINRFRYAEVASADRHALDAYLAKMQGVGVSLLNRAEQKAYWVNVYNAFTVKVILDHYPVKSITDIDISPGFFSNGPWDARLLDIEGEKVSLNDIEHRILRPIFRDNRLHYALNCASLGCPNLQPEAYSSGGIDEMLDAAAQEYVNSPRAARFVKGTLQVSSIYKWFQEDFGGTEEGVISHLQKYARGELANALKSYNKGLRYDYDWGLNQP